MSIDKDKLIEERLGQTRPLTVRVPQIVIDKLQNEGFSLAKVVRLALVEKVLEFDDSEEIRYLLEQNKQK